MSLLIVGSVALDTIETPFGKVKDALGGSAVYSSISASYFTNVNIVAVVGKDFPEKHVNELKKHKINVNGLEVVDGKTFRWVGHYMNDLNSAQTIDTQLNVFEKFNPVIPYEYKNIKNVFLANIDPELQFSVYKQLDSPKIVACDTMNFWITNKLAELKKLLKVVDILLINEGEIKQLAREQNVIKSAKIVSKLGPKTIIVKRGEYGSMCFYKENIFAIPAYPLENIFDPTGAGDSFAGGFMGYVTKCGKIDEKILRQAIVFGTVTGSFCVENFSIKKISAINYHSILRRYKSIKQLTYFEDIKESSTIN